MTRDQFIRYLQGHCTEQEFDQIMELLRDASADFFDREEAEQVWNDFEPAEASEKMKYQLLLEKIHQRIEPAGDAKTVTLSSDGLSGRWLTLLTRAAAILLLPVLSLLLYTLNSDKAPMGGTPSDLVVEAPAGSTMNFMLADGTKVWLNHGAKLTFPYQFKGKERMVQLRGEAYFVVAHNKEVPFIVETDHLDVKATGTEFNVSAYGEDPMEVTTLMEGKVILYDKDSHRQIKELSPDQSLKFNVGTRDSHLEEGNSEKYVAWKNGLLVFKNDPIADIANKLGKWYNVDVEIINEKAKGYTCTATFTDETLGQVLELMSLPTPVYFQLMPREKAPDGSFVKQKVRIGLKDNQR